MQSICLSKGSQPFACVRHATNWCVWWCVRVCGSVEGFGGIGMAAGAQAVLIFDTPCIKLTRPGAYL